MIRTRVSVSLSLSVAFLLAILLAGCGGGSSGGDSGGGAYYSGGGGGSNSTGDSGGTTTVQWTRDSGVRFSEGTAPSTIFFNSLYYTYYSYPGGIYLATSSDGLTYTKYGLVLTKSGALEADGVANPAIVQLSDGRLRLYYNGITGTSQRVLSATSSDGKTFERDSGIRLDPTTDADDGGQASVPCVTRFPDGSYRMYYTYGFYTVNSLRSAISTDEGMTWTRQNLTGFSNNSMDPCVIVLSLSPQTFRLFFAFSATTGTNPTIKSAVSNDGINWTVEEGSRIIATYPDEGVAVGDPDVILLPSGKYRMYYYGRLTTGYMNVLSAVSP